MMLPNAWDALEWWPVAVTLVVVGAILAAISYWRSPGSTGYRCLAAGLKVLALSLLALCLLEPVHQFTRPEPGANLLMVLADDSQSLLIKDRGDAESRADQVTRVLKEDAGWLSRLSEVFDVRRYQVDQALRPVANFTQYQADQRGTNLLGNLKLVAGRFEGRPAAGMVIITDGNDAMTSTGSASQTINQILADVDWPSMPPIYPIVVGDDKPAADIAITKVVSTQTNFETAPITIDVSMVAYGFAGQKLAVEMLDETGELLEKKEVAQLEDGREFRVRFQARPREPGVNAYQIRALPANLNPADVSLETTEEATLVNNEQTVVVNRGRGPYRILYVCGRPNWELKFLQRAMLNDPEVDLVSLIRIAKREAKFTFRGREGQQSNSLFRGFESQDDDTTEQADEPVFLRIGTKTEDELQGGFPKAAEVLFEYDAIVLDDIEADFFNEDQKSLLQEFVALRGGGLLMVGGQESFASGGFDRTPIGEMLPVYLDRLTPPQEGQEYRLSLTREGWLQPWVRLEATELEERKRLERMPGFRTLNQTDSIKPGASVLATVNSADRQEVPALVVQPFGKGRVGSLLIGDFWRWHMKNPVETNEFYKAWRQMARWLVAEVPRRVELEVVREAGSLNARRIIARVVGPDFKPYDNAKVKFSVTLPEVEKPVPLSAANADEAGVYTANFSTSTNGVYKVVAEVEAEDGSFIESREFGWVCDPDREEFQQLTPNIDLLESLAARSGGKVIKLDEIDQLPEMIESSPVPISQQKTLPWWHRWSILSLALGLLVTEWGLRRWKGLP